MPYHCQPDWIPRWIDSSEPVLGSQASLHIAKQTHSSRNIEQDHACCAFDPFIETRRIVAIDDPFCLLYRSGVIGMKLCYRPEPIKGSGLVTQPVEMNDRKVELSADQNR
ncbi:hypothetical protein [Asaia astilbis]|uniref:hypothetical protein n=1 Tax=Asaia astilbis TaxID=610244 RepID=UPI0012EC6F6B|nr:hypothetical protein [Asaia astilbis]